MTSVSSTSTTSAAPVAKASMRKSPTRWLTYLAGLFTVAIFAVFIYQAGMFAILLPKPKVVAAVLPKNDQVVTSNSRISGMDKENQPYNIKAATSVQDDANKQLIKMTIVSGQLHKTDGEILTVSADKGLYNTELKLLDLQGNVQIVSNGRYVAKLKDAQVDVKGKILTTKKPVLVTFDGGEISSSGMKISENGSHILFTNGVKSQFNHDENKKDSEK